MKTLRKIMAACLAVLHVGCSSVPVKTEQSNPAQTLAQLVKVKSTRNKGKIHFFDSISENGDVCSTGAYPNFLYIKNTTREEDEEKKLTKLYFDEGYNGLNVLTRVPGSLSFNEEQDAIFNALQIIYDIQAGKKPEVSIILPTSSLEYGDREIFAFDRKNGIFYKMDVGKSTESSCDFMNGVCPEALLADSNYYDEIQRAIEKIEETREK